MITGLYVHVPFCTAKCAYCAFYSRPYDAAQADAYLDALEREIELAPVVEPTTVYVGGGTPTCLSEPQLERLLGMLGRTVSTRRVQEYTIEANPETVTPSITNLLARLGVNRVSLGVQSLDNGTLRRLGRTHSAKTARRAFACLRRAGFENIGIDLIGGVPGTNPSNWTHTVTETVRLGPAHISVYALTIEEGSALFDNARTRMPMTTNDAVQLDELRTAEQILTGAGYARYEISNYAKPGFECRHNLACWRGEQYLGLGPSAASHVAPHRWTNTRDLHAYLDRLGHGHDPPRSVERLTNKTVHAERLMLGIRTSAGIETPRAPTTRKRLEQLVQYGLVAPHGTRWVLTQRGRELADAVTVHLLG